MLVSVIMPTYNCGKFIEQSIKSVIDQTVTDWELQIVDDCSTDETACIVKKYTEQFENIYYFRFSENKGPAAARSEAIKRSSGRYVAFLDSDDLWTNDKLEKQIEFMEKTGTVFSATAYSQISETGASLQTIHTPPARTDYAKMLRLSNPIGNSTVMYDQSKLGKYQVPLIKKRNDFALWLRILKSADACYGMDEVLAHYRLREDSVSSNKLGQARYHWQLYFHIEKLGLFKSAFYILCWAVVKGTGLGLNRRKGI